MVLLVRTNRNFVKMFGSMSCMHENVSSMLQTALEDLQALEKMAPLYSSMIEAARRNNIGVLRVCIEAGCNVNYRCSEYGFSALSHAAREGHLLAVRWLLAAGANPNLKDKMNQTPLCRAAYRGHLDVVRELLHHGADPTIEDAFGQTAQHFSCQEGHWRVQKKLIHAEARWVKQLQKSRKVNLKELQALERRRVENNQTLRLEKAEFQKLERKFSTTSRIRPVRFPLSSSSSIVVA